MMQLGFALLEAGAYRSINTVTILYKNIVDFSATAIAWWLFGFSIYHASGDDNAGGSADMGTEGGTHASGEFILLLGFASTAVTIQSGCVAARTSLGLYMTQSVVLGNVIFPFVARWCWKEGGWLQKRGFIDFAGGSVVHVLGGAASYIACRVVGQRRCTRPERGEGSGVLSVSGHSLTLTYLGSMILWVGWLFFNAGSTQSVSSGGDVVALTCLVNSFLCPAFAIVACSIASNATAGVLDMDLALNSVLGALAAVTSGSAVIKPWGAAIQGLVVGGAFLYVHRWMMWQGIDDPVDAIAVHAVCGAFGTLTLPFFIDKEAYALAYGESWSKTIGEQFGEQILGTLVIAGFAIAVNIAVILVFWSFRGIRVDPAIEDTGMDTHLFGISAYPEIKEVIVFQDNLKKLKRKYSEPGSSRSLRAPEGAQKRRPGPKNRFNRFRRPMSAYSIAMRSQTPIEMKSVGDASISDSKAKLNGDPSPKLLRPIPRNALEAQDE